MGFLVYTFICILQKILNMFLHFFTYLGEISLKPLEDFAWCSSLANWWDKIHYDNKNNLIACYFLYNKNQSILFEKKRNKLFIIITKFLANHVVYIIFNYLGIIQKKRKRIILQVSVCLYPCRCHSYPDGHFQTSDTYIFHLLSVNPLSKSIHNVA